MKFTNQYQSVVPFILFGLALLLLFKIVQPMITILLGSILIAYITYPLQLRINKKIKSKSISIILALFIIVIIVLIPFSFLAFEITQQGYHFYNSLSAHITKGAVFGFGCVAADSKVCHLLNQVEKFSKERLSSFGFDKQLQKLLPILEEKLTQFILNIPVTFAKIILTLIIAYFVLKDWRNILRKTIEILPMRKKTITRLSFEFENIANTVIYAQLLVAIIQGLIASIGFYLFGIPFPIFLGVVLAFCALIPTIGTALIWTPAALILILTGYLSSDYSILWSGIGLFAYGFFIISTIDNILLTKIVHSKAKVNQILIIVGVIGGASLFGIVGIFIGPIMLPLLLTYFETFKERFN